MPADLQDHPHEIPKFIEKWEEGYHIVWGVREHREDGLIERLTSRLFGEVIRRIALKNYPVTGTGGFSLIDRMCVDAFNSYSERNRHIVGLLLFSGFRQTQILYTRQKRAVGKSKFSFRRRLRTAIDAIVSFSVLPLRFASVTGIVVALSGFVYGAVQIIDRFTYGTRVPGFTQTIVVIMVIGGLQLVTLGVIGEYLWRVLDDVRRRPLFLVQSLHGDFPGVFPPLPPYIHSPAVPFAGGCNEPRGEERE